MKITITLKDDKARWLQHILRERYGKNKNARLENLIKLLLVDVITDDAKRDVEKAMADLLIESCPTMPKSICK